MGATAGTRKSAPLSTQDDFDFFDGKPYPLGLQVNVRILPDQLIWTQSGIGPNEAFSGLTAALPRSSLCPATMISGATFRRTNIQQKAAPDCSGAAS